MKGVWVRAAGPHLVNLVTLDILMLRHLQSLSWGEAAWLPGFFAPLWFVIPYTSSELHSRRLQCTLGQETPTVFPCPLFIEEAVIWKKAWNHHSGHFWGSLHPESSAWRTFSPENLHCSLLTWLTLIKGLLCDVWLVTQQALAHPETPVSCFKAPTSGSEWLFIPRKQGQTLHRGWLGWAEPFSRKCCAVSFLLTEILDSTPVSLLLHAFVSEAAWSVLCLDSFPDCALLSYASHLESLESRS